MKLYISIWKDSECIVFDFLLTYDIYIHPLLLLHAPNERTNDRPTAQLAAAEAAVDEARRECEAVVEEWRDPDLRAAYGVERLQTIREQAKTALTVAEK